MMMKRYFFVLLFVFMAVLLLGQEHGRMAGMQAREGIVYGTIIEASTGAAVEYANIAIYSVRDSSILGGGISDRRGNFKIEKLPYGRMYAEINFIGYAPQTIPNIVIRPDKAVVNLGRLKLGLTAELLQEVSVEAQVNQVDYKLDRKVINVNQDILSAGATAVEALENVPSVTTDLDGNVQLRGSENFMVLIDGRPTPLEGSEALQQIPAASIENIEIITNPSAKYESEGVGGIINVILKKERRKGFNGQVEANYGRFNSFGGNALFNIRSNKVNFFVGGEYGSRRSKSNGTNNSTTFMPDSIDYILNKSSHDHGNRSYGNGRMGIDIFITDNDVLTFSGKYGRGGHNDDTEAQTETFYQRNDSTFNSFCYESNSRMEAFRNHLTGDVNYMKKFRKPGHELQIYGSYSYNFKDNINHTVEHITDAAWEQLPGLLPIDYRTVETDTGHRVVSRIDYVLPVGKKGKIEAGYNVKYTASYSDYNYQKHLSGEWVDSSELFNPFHFKRNIQSGYLIFANYWGNFGYQIGLRTEYTDRLFRQLTDGGHEYGYRKFDFFPSAHLSYRFSEKLQLMASYSRRLARPRPWNLNPFETYYDENTVSRGNPNLRPEYLNSVDISAQQRFGTHFISIEAYWRGTNNRIDRLTIVDSTDQRRFVRTSDNIGKDQSAGAEIMGNFNVTRWYNLNISGTGYYHEIIAHEDRFKSQSTFLWRLRVNNTFRIKRSGTSIQLGGMYISPRINVQGRSEAMGMVNLGIRQTLCDRKLAISLNLRDLFGTMNFKSTQDTRQFHGHTERHRLAPRFSISITYKINDFTKRREHDQPEQEMNGDEEM